MRIALLCASRDAELVERALKLGGVAVDAVGAGGLQLVGAVAAGQQADRSIRARRAASRSQTASPIT